jgi:predicted TIM-barrel fold metal-dependent hydrolase
MIDVHTHIFNFKYVPDGYFQKFLVRRKDVWKVSIFLDNLLPWTDKDKLSSYAQFLKTGNGESMKDIFDNMVRYYPPKTIFTPLMMDLQFGFKGCAAEDNTFDDQVREMIGIKKSNSDIVFPFLAVDPRRDGILDLVQQYVGEHKDFSGIKIYPALGYLPSHPRLMEVFGYCADKGIPVTTHCSKGGVRTDFYSVPVEGTVFNGIGYEFINEKKRFFLKYKWKGFFNDPRNWVPVLEKYNNLRLNLAHFGGEDEWRFYLEGKKGTWVDKVMNLAIHYDNVYTDISYTFCHRDYYPAIKKMIAGPLGEKILFGSDYYMAEMEGHFYSSINTVFVELTGDELHRISEDNPRKFLGL